MAYIKMIGDSGDVSHGSSLGIQAPQSASSVAAQLSNQESSGWTHGYDVAWNNITGGMTMDQFRALPQAEQSKISGAVQAAISAQAYPESLFEKIAGGVALAATVGGATAGLGATVSPLFGTSGSILSGTAGQIAGGAITSAGSDAFKNALTGQSIGAGALEGAITGGLGAAASPLTGGLASATGLPTAVAGDAVKGALGAGVGALGGAISGTGAGAGALRGGAGGLISGVAGNVVGATNSATGSPAVGALAGTAAGALGTMAISPLLSGGGNSTTSPYSTGAVGTNAGAGTSFLSSLLGPSVGNTVGGVLGSVGTSAAGVYGAQNAAEDETKWINNAIGEQQTTLGNVNNIYGTQISAGNNAFSDLQALEGGAPGSGNPAANYSNFENSPGYQFAISQGTQAINREASAQGGLYTPNTLTNVGQYVTNTANTNYNNYVNSLLSTAQLGASGNQGLAGATTTIGANISQLMQSEGQAQASGVAGAAGAIGSGLSSLFGTGGGTGVGTGVNASGTGNNAADPNDPYAYDQAAGAGPNATSFTGYDANGNPGTYDFNGNLISGGAGATNYGSGGDFGGGVNYGSNEGWLTDFGGGD